MGTWINGRPVQEYLRDQASDNAARETSEFSGSFGERAKISLDLPSGRIEIKSHSGDRDWRLSAGHAPDGAPIVDSDLAHLSIAGSAKDSGGIEVRSSGGGFASVSSFAGGSMVIGGLVINAGASGPEMVLDLPMGLPLDFDLRLRSGSGSLNGAGLIIGILRAKLASGDLDLDLSAASVAELDLRIASGDLDITLPERDGLRVETDIASGDLTIGVPEGLGLRLDLKLASGDKHGFGKLGLNETRRGHWETPADPDIDAWCAMDVQVASGDFRLKRV
jgi:hypothetical protein